MDADDNPDVVAQIHATYPEMGRALYFDIEARSHAVLYTLPGQRLNWIWCVS